MKWLLMLSKNGRKSISLSMLCLIMLLLSSCQNGERVDAFCFSSAPIYLHNSDQLSSATTKEILKHDKYGEDHCGWKTP